jgi:hypothetical protein
VLLLLLLLLCVLLLAKALALLLGQTWCSSHRQRRLRLLSQAVCRGCHIWSPGV